MYSFWILVVCVMLCNAGHSQQANNSWQTESEEEALFLRRIADFWEEGEYKIAKSQMEEFISQYPQSLFSDALCSALGDLFLREKNFHNALDYYSKVKSADFVERNFLSRMQCLYENQWHATLADECEAYLQKESPAGANQRLRATYFLAISLYQQCLNATQNPEISVKLAKRAQPYFESLFQSELSSDVAQGFAHLCCILKDFPKAVQIYLDLAKNDTECKEDHLFQAALIAAEYDKENAIKIFGDIAQLGGNRSKEAAYNRLVLSHEAGLHEELNVSREALISSMPPEKIGLAHLFVGRSLMALKHYSEAIPEIKSYVQNSDSSSNAFEAALISLLEASQNTGDLETLDFSIDNLEKNYPKSSELSKAHYIRTQILTTHQRPQDAKVELEKYLVQFPQSELAPQALFDLMQLDYQEGSQAGSQEGLLHCYERGNVFFSQFPKHNLSSSAWRLFLFASEEMAKTNPDLRMQLIEDLEKALSQEGLFSAAEVSEWNFLLAKAHFEMGSFDRAISYLEPLLSPEISFVQKPNAMLLLALCYRDGLGNLKSFCELGEAALAHHATLLKIEDVHLALFNAYLERSDETGRGAEHLFAAFERNATIKVQNLLWLANYYYESNATRATTLLEHVIALEGPRDEEACKLAGLYAQAGRTNDQIALLEKVSEPSPEAKLLLAEGYLHVGREDDALQLFEAVLKKSPTLRNETSASACLQSARLKIKKQIEPIQVASQLKDLILQKNLLNEPIHLEAALEYVHLQTDPEKQLSLLKKTKNDFEKRGDILSRDYHEARTKFPRKDRIYQGYMQLMAAEIFLSESLSIQDPTQQKELQSKAKDLLLQIVNEQVHPDLCGRARLEITTMNGS